MRYGDRPRSRGFAQYRPTRRRGAGFTIIEVMIVITIIGILVAAVVPIFVGGNMEERRADAVRTAETFGFSGVRITESSRWASQNGCGQDDRFAFQATATNSVDKKVSIVICCGRGSKGCTVRVR